MSDILISGMEMPNNCLECAFVQLSFGFDYYCPRAKDTMTFYDIQSKRMPRCPLVELPPHGDLIDKDVLIDSADAEYIDGEFWAVSLGMITKQPVVVCGDNCIEKNDI